MRRLNAKFQGNRCSGCGAPILVGNPIDYDEQHKKAYHACSPQGPVDLTEAHALADRLGFIREGDAIPGSWGLPVLHEALGSDTAGRLESQALLV